MDAAASSGGAAGSGVASTTTVVGTGSEPDEGRVGLAAEQSGGHVGAAVALDGTPTGESEVSGLVTAMPPGESAAEEKSSGIVVESCVSPLLFLLVSYCTSLSFGWVAVTSTEGWSRGAP